MLCHTPTMSRSKPPKEVHVVREVAVPPARVWSLVTDLPRMGEWSPENRGGEWAGGATGPSVGARFRGRNTNGKRSWSTVVRVTACDEPTRFVFALRVFGVNWCDWVWEISPTPAGSSIKHSWIDHRGGTAVWLGRVVSGVADRARHNRKNMEATMDRLVAALAG